MRHRPQRFMVAAVFLILGLGLLCLFSACHQKGVFIREEVFRKQVVWVLIGLGCMILVSRIDYRRTIYIMPVLYVAVVGCLIFVTTKGRAIMGAQRWISLGELSFQPSELGKFALILVLARYYSSKTALGFQSDAHGAGFLRAMTLPLAFTLLPTLLVMEQPDLGTGLVYMFIFASIAFIAGVKLRFLFGMGAAGLLAMPVFWHVLKDYQKSRLLVFLNPNSDPLGAGYTVIQSKIAIGSGGFLGKGWMSGTQGQLNFLAERHTDFIFSVWGEEWGFLGSFALLVLYGLLIFAILRTAEIAKDLYGQLIAVGIASVLFFHVGINIAMNAGMCPVVGLPLPFFSYGGTSLVINLIVLGVVWNIARQK